MARVNGCERFDGVSAERPSSPPSTGTNPSPNERVNPMNGCTVGLIARPASLEIAHWPAEPFTTVHEDTEREGCERFECESSMNELGEPHEGQNQENRSQPFTPFHHPEKIALPTTGEARGRERPHPRRRDVGLDGLHAADDAGDGRESLRPSRLP